MALQQGAKLLLNTDSHDGSDLLTATLAHAIVRGTGLDENASRRVLVENPSELIARLTMGHRTETTLPTVT
jgi:hypothetical protein